MYARFISLLAWLCEQRFHEGVSMLAAGTLVTQQLHSKVTSGTTAVTFQSGVTVSSNRKRLVVVIMAGADGLLQRVFLSMIYVCKMYVCRYLCVRTTPYWVMEALY